MPTRATMLRSRRSSGRYDRCVVCHRSRLPRRIDLAATGRKARHPLPNVFPGGRLELVQMAAPVQEREEVSILVNAQGRALQRTRRVTRDAQLR